MKRGQWRHSGVFVVNFEHVYGRTGENVLEGRAEIVPKILLHINLLMIRSTISILPLVFTNFIICLRHKKKILRWLRKQTYICVKRLVLFGTQLIKEYKSIVSGLIKTISDMTLYRLHLTKILQKNVFHHHPIASK